MNEKEIIEILHTNWATAGRIAIRNNGEVDIGGDCIIRRGSDFDSIPIKFGEIGGNFSCKRTNILNLVNGPKSVRSDFDVGKNELTSLIGSPLKVIGEFLCDENNISSLEGITPMVGLLNCSSNPLTSLEFCPETEQLECSKCELTSLRGINQSVRELACKHNKLTSFEFLPPLRFLQCTWYETTHLLRLVSLPKECFMEILDDFDIHAKQIYDIIHKYKGQTPLRQAIIQCQKELIDAGFKENAKL